jgi:ribonuclease HI
MILHAFTDGASRGNPGESGIGLILKDEQGTVLLSESSFIGITTNNVAEYTALLTLLRRMKDIACTRLIVHSDSELMVRQLNGTYRVRDEGLKGYYRKVLQLLGDAPFQFEVKYIPRASNKDADRLANIGIDARKPGRV